MSEYPDLGIYFYRSSRLWYWSLCPMWWSSAASEEYHTMWHHIMCQSHMLCSSVPCHFTTVSASGGTHFSGLSFWFLVWLNAFHALKKIKNPIVPQLRSWTQFVPSFLLRAIVINKVVPPHVWSGGGWGLCMCKCKRSNYRLRWYWVHREASGMTLKLLCD